MEREGKNGAGVVAVRVGRGEALVRREEGYFLSCPFFHQGQATRLPFSLLLLWSAPFLPVSFNKKYDTF